MLTEYYYDLEDPASYQTKHNRLMYYEVFEDGQLAERVDYEYELEDSSVGNPISIVRKPSAEQTFYATGLEYNNSGELLVLKQRTYEEDVDGNPINEQILRIDEFRGGGRQRYMTRQRDPNDQTIILPGTTVWTFYDGDEPYGDYTVDEEGVVTDTKAYELGIGQIDLATGEVSYFHQDQGGSTRMQSDQGSGISGQWVYTAFGEKVLDQAASGTRYQYVGNWGYESSDEFPFIHVGARYYGPSVGRFLQRDPIGILGGLNLYEYVHNNPLSFIDPKGLDEKYPIVGATPKFKKKYEDLLPKLTPWYPGSPCGGSNYGSGWVEEVIIDLQTPAVFKKYSPVDFKYRFKKKMKKGLWQRTKDWLKRRLPLRPADPNPCFVEGTQVLTANGPVNIENLDSDAEVIARRMGSGEMIDSDISMVHSSLVRELIHITIGAETIECTKQHPFWVVGRGWVEAGDLRDRHKTTNTILLYVR